ncbi:hypothetical protein FQA47_016550 [Oryzias melastigma]|uniref:Uncharacterized protein n=1 Tax=Oryzias melastigma TaxID=30732 RepID=A0A834EZK5_ORYME|nr:hypothetical protein FQA47_016550 [Oryzias melastigma]
MRCFKVCICALSRACSVKLTPEPQEAAPQLVRKCSGLVTRRCASVLRAAAVSHEFPAWWVHACVNASKAVIRAVKFDAGGELSDPSKHPRMVVGACARGDSFDANSSRGSAGARLGPGAGSGAAPAGIGRAAQTSAGRLRLSCEAAQEQRVCFLRRKMPPQTQVSGKAELPGVFCLQIFDLISQSRAGCSPSFDHVHACTRLLKAPADFRL